MGHHYSHLNMAERRQIMKLLERKVPLTQIAKIVGRHQSTLYRELRRNYYRDEYPQWSGWFPWNATESARKRRFKRRNLERDRELRLHVIEKLEQHWSPEQIAGRLKLHPMGNSKFGRICSETIYRFVYERSNREMALYTLLAKRRRTRRGLRGRKPRGSHIPLYCNIKHRPEDIANRETFGHWEADLIIFRRDFGKANITSLIERKSRYQVVIRNKDRNSSGVLSAIQQQLRPLPARGRQSITFDRGTEFMAWKTLHQSLGIKSYFCDTASPYQKGSVENANGRLRRYLPLETDLQAVEDVALSAIALRMNNTPHQCLGYRTPGEVFNAELAHIKSSC
ncbi:IS30 family transposase [Asticcacaulis sp. ZE23SCel15]|uniref:IS30 family transposase n=1 Tax=Asticcacaulis sp. ZE23SCel15 TaxID=3059027 RepID=UPI00265E5942|nr:IS30 family transposase [Asticcacaulis sp. ZE23SCel15]WKL56629.1 IS30 family transposase [Asticcacaulis sp. ZE23SCel15]